MNLNKIKTILLGLLLSPLCFSAALADKPQPWQIDFQTPVTPVMEKVYELHNLVLLIITLVALFVIVVLGYIILRFRASKNPVPSKTSHNTFIEVIWTAAPVIILLIIALPSFKLIFYADKAVDPEMTIKVTGHMWYWKYDYPESEISFDSNMIPDEELQPGQLRLLEVDNQIVVPVDTTVRLLFTAADVLHSWAIPSFGVKKDCAPGRLNETWIKVTKEGTYYGQCSELCGMKHGFMPIVVKVVSKQAYEQWITEAKEKFA